MSTNLHNPEWLAKKPSSTARDPRIDPQAGDTIEKVSDAGGVSRRRTVTRREDNDIFYLDHKGKHCKCWISSWMEWARMATLEGAVTNTSPAMRAKELILQRSETIAEHLVGAGPKQHVEAADIIEAFKRELVSENDIVRHFRRGLRRVISRVQDL